MWGWRAFGPYAMLRLRQVARHPEAKPDHVWMSVGRMVRRSVERVARAAAPQTPKGVHNENPSLVALRKTKPQICQHGPNMIARLSQIAKSNLAIWPSTTHSNGNSAIAMEIEQESSRLVLRAFLLGF